MAESKLSVKPPADVNLYSDRCEIPKRKPCKGELDIDLDHTSGHISWRCEVCGDEGVVSGWEGLIWDMLDTDGKIH